MKTFLFALSLLCFLATNAQMSNQEIKEKVIGDLSWNDAPDDLDRLNDFKIVDVDYTVKRNYVNESATSRAAKVVQVDYVNSDGKRIIYEAIAGIMYDARNSKYYLAFDKEHYYKFGTWKIYDDYDNLYEIRKYNDGGLLAVLESYEDGELWYVEKFKGKERGEEAFETYFYEDGVLDYKEMEDADYGLNSDGSVNWKISKVNGNRHGPFEQYFTDTKQVQYKGTYVNGNKEGKYESFYKNGAKKEVASYKNGDRNGSYVSYLEDGTIEEEGAYVKGDEDGTWKILFETSSDFEYPYFTDEDFDLEEALQLGEYFYKQGKFRNGEETGDNVVFYYVSGEKLMDIKGSKLLYYYTNGETCLEGKVDRYGEPKGDWNYYNRSGGLIKKLEVD